MMWFRCTLASVSASSPLRSSTMASRVLVKFPPKHCQAAAKCNGMQISRMSTLSQNCCVSKAAGVLLRCSPVQLRKSFLHNQPLYRITGLHRAMWDALLRARGGVWMESVGTRLVSGGIKNTDSYHKRTGLIYVCAAAVTMLGMSYAGVPLYRMFCQVMSDCVRCLITVRIIFFTDLYSALCGESISIPIHLQLN